MKDDDLAKLFDAPVHDAGFNERVLAALPAQQRLVEKRFFWLPTLLGGVAACIATFVFSGIDGLSESFTTLMHSTAFAPSLLVPCFALAASCTAFGAWLWAEA